MDTITIRNVPPQVRKALKEKARRSGRSLQQVALQALEETAERLTPEEWMSEVRESVARNGTRLGSDEVLRLLHEERSDADA